MGREIEIAKTEPTGLAKMRHEFETAKTVALDAPSALDAELSGQSIQNGIDVGRNMQSPPLDIVGCIDDDGQIFGSNRVLQPLHQFCAAGAASQNDDHLRSPRITVIVGGSQQAPSQQSDAIDDTKIGRAH